jgi:hypothetical protein
MAELVEGDEDPQNNEKPPGLLHQEPETIGRECQGGKGHGAYSVLKVWNVT